MADKISKKRRSANMAAIRSKNMKPELAVRYLTHRLGLRFRLHKKDLPGRPDIVLTRHKAVIFVHGCFWHQHASSDCKDSRRPKSNTDYWDAKLRRNVDRDNIQVKALTEQGWRVLTIWECELGSPQRVTNRIARFLKLKRAKGELHVKD